MNSFNQLLVENNISLVFKNSWWREIVAIDPETVNWGTYPKNFYKKAFWTDL